MLAQLAGLVVMHRFERDCGHRKGLVIVGLILACWIVITAEKMQLEVSQVVDSCKMHVCMCTLPEYLVT